MRPAAESRCPATGRPAKQFFFGKGQCASCHMVYGEGAPIGPDLSNVAREMTVDQIREALLQPDARIAPGYELVTVRLRDGQTLRGFARSRTRFDIALQDLKGVFHPLSLDQRLRHRRGETIADAAGEGRAERMQNLIAYLSRLTGVQPGLPTPASFRRRAESTSRES